MFSLKSWSGASDHCKTAAEIPYIMLENPSKNDVFFCVPAAVRGGIVYSSVSSSGWKQLMPAQDSMHSSSFKLQNPSGLQNTSG